MSLKILQISDLHIGEKNKLFDMEEFVAQIVFAQTGEPDIILVTGDIFDGEAFGGDGYEKLIEEAVNFFNHLITSINSEYGISLSSDSILFLPGNHEVYKKNALAGKDIFFRYKIFLDTFYHDELPKYYFEKDLSLLRVFPNEKIIIMGFSSPNHGKDNKGEEEFFGQITVGQVNAMRKKVNDIDNYAEYNMVVALHHHFYMIEEHDKAYVDNSSLRDSELFCQVISLNFLSRRHCPLDMCS